MEIKSNLKVIRADNGYCHPDYWSFGSFDKERITDTKLCLHKRYSSISIQGSKMELDIIENFLYQLKNAEKV